MACLESLSKSKSVPGLEFTSPRTGFPKSKMKIDLLACGLHRQQTHVGVLCEEELIACLFFPVGFRGGKCMLNQLSSRPSIADTLRKATCGFLGRGRRKSSSSASSRKRHGHCLLLSLQP